MTAAPHGDGFVHDAFFYADEADLIAWAAPFLREAVEEGEHALLVCEPRRRALVLDAVKDERVIGLDQRELYLRVPAAIAAVKALMQSGLGADGTPVRMVGEIDYGVSRQDQTAWSCYEAVTNRYYAPFHLWGTCLYDVRRLPASVLVDANLTHPQVRDRDGRRTNDNYIDPQEFLRSIGPQIQTPPEPLAEYRLSSTAELAPMRQRLGSLLTSVRVPASVRADCLVAVGELAANAFVHGMPPVDVRVAHQEDQFVFDVVDRGTGFHDPFFGFVPADQLSTRGRGLWMARHLCSAIETAYDGVMFRVRAAVDETRPRVLDLLT